MASIDHLQQGKEVHAAARGLSGNTAEQRRLFADARAALKTALSAAWITATMGDAGAGADVDVSPLDLLEDPGLEAREAIRKLATLIPIATHQRLGIMHYPVQIAAGLALVDGHVIQLATGEGKTIVGLFPEVVFGLLAQIDREVRSGYPVRHQHRSVHVITANPLLAERDALWLAPVLSWFDLKASRLDHTSSIAAQVAANEAEIVFGTAADFVFVHLRQETARREGERGLGSPYVLLVDEIDHSFIDEATLPFIVTDNPTERDAEVRVVNHLGRLAKAMVEESSLITLPKHPSQTLQLTPIGIAAVDAMVAEALLEPPEEGDEAPSPGPSLAILGTLLQRMGTVLRQQIGSTAADFAAVSKQELEQALGHALKDFNANLKGDGGDVRAVLEALFRSRHVLSELMAQTICTPEQLAEIQDLVLNQLGLTQLLRGNTGRAAAFLAEIIDSLGSVQLARCRSSHPQHLAGHLRACIAMLRQVYGPEGVSPALAVLDKELESHGVAPRSPGPDVAFGTDLNHFWVQPLFQALHDGTDPRLPVLHRFLQLLMSLFARVASNVRPTSSRDREMIKLGNDLGRWLSHPTLFVFDPDTRRIVLQVPGRALLARYLRGFLERDLWPDVEGQRVLADAREFSDLLSSVETLFLVGMSAHLFYSRNHDYLVQTTQRGARDVVIISSLTGFPLPGRRWSGLIHSFLEHKEGIAVKPEASVRNRISMQRFAQRYPCILGMSATVQEAEDEFLSTYGSKIMTFEPYVARLAYACTGARASALADPLAPIVVVDSAREADLQSAVERFLDLHAHRAERPITLLAREEEIVDLVCERLVARVREVTFSRGWVSNRQEVQDRVYLTQAAKERAVCELVAEAHAKRMPVLVETSSVEDCQRYHDMISKRLSIPADRIQQLDARNENRAAEIFSLAGQAGAITVATQMAGRGVDIILQPAAVQAGGLLVASTERRSSRRWDRQIAGRAARQGDPGFSCFFLSTEDPLMRRVSGQRANSWLTAVGMAEDQSIESPLISHMIATNQAQTEDYSRAERANEMALDGEIAEIQNAILSVRSVVVSDHQPCLNSSRRDRHPLIRNADRSVVCTRCKAEGKSDPPAEAWLREPIRALISDAIEQALRLMSAEEYLVQRYAPEGTVPNEWDLAGLAVHLSEMIGAKVDVHDLADKRSWRERVNLDARGQIAGANPIWRPLFKLKERVTRRSDEEHHARLVNLSEVWAPEIESRVLKRRIRDMLTASGVRRFLAAVEKTLARGGRRAPHDAALAIIEVLRDPSGPWADLLPRAERALTGWLKSPSLDALHEELQAFIEEEWTLTAEFAGASGEIDYSQHHLVALLKPLAPEPPVGARDASALRRWAQAAISHWYQGVDALGKPRLYAEENRIVREAIDEAFPRFLSRMEVHAHQLKFRYQADRVRAYRAVTRDLEREMRAEIGAKIIAAWPTITASATEKSGQLPVPWPDPIASCRCGSGSMYHACCGRWLHAGASA